jgi:hypothetical protein
VARGYHRDMFDEAFARFLPESAPANHYAVTIPVNIGDSDGSETSPSNAWLRFENDEIVNKDAGGNGVTVREAGQAQEERFLQFSIANRI